MEIQITLDGFSKNDDGEFVPKSYDTITIIPDQDDSGMVLISKSHNYVKIADLQHALDLIRSAVNRPMQDKRSIESVHNGLRGNQ